MFGTKNKSKEKLKQKKGYNPYLLAKIQPQGGVKFEESYIRKGDGFETCVHIHDFQTVVSDFWLERIMNMPNMITTLDVISDNRKEVVESINKSMSEQTVRHDTAKDNIDRIDARKQYQELEFLYNQIGEGEVMKRIHLRIYISEKTIDELEKQVKFVIETLESYNFRGAIFLNEQEYEWDALVSSFEVQKNYINKRKGKEIPSLSLAGGCPFHFTYLSDPYGTFYGTTKTKGCVIFDQFHRDKQRKSYNAVLIGKMGAGKSTLLKKATLDNAIKGYKIRGFDIVGEFEDLVHALGGKQISLDGTEGIINPLQVYKTAEAEEVSFGQHLSKLTIFYRFISPRASDEIVQEYENLLRKLYIEKGLWDDTKGANNHITGKDATEYPIFSDFLELIRNELYIDGNYKDRKTHENLSDSLKERLEIIELNIANLVGSYGNLFDGPSSINSFHDEQIVFFSLRHLSSFREEIFRAQIFNVMNLLWDEMLQNGIPQYHAFNKKMLSFEDAVRFLIIIDEAHHIINTKPGSEYALDFLTKFSREARKYFAGLFYASHSIRDFVPENSEQRIVEQIKILFELTQYKFIMQQDSNSLGMLKRIFAGELSESEISEIPYLNTGDVLLSIGAVKNVLFNVEVTDEELALFGGGA
ncbi:VirB4 family type IV secretion system protein [Bacillus cereus group sp. BfR-BA-01329]|uniref:VirB4 family type IV secretion system protein n=1 Tax=Bacillus cereus group sp. BfR-BA-01329 TaxID=2920305 RepID=UPI001F586986|nr:type IV secretion system protein VirB4 [Bacillus cereus group sp. BfR-BA-01329]